MAGDTRWTGDSGDPAHKPPQPYGAAPRAFTLVELLVVLAMLSIIAAMGLPRINSARYKSDAAAQLARTLLQNAQREAITRQNNVILSLDTATNRIRVVQDFNNNDVPDGSERVTWRRLEEGARFAAPPMGRVDGAALTVPYAGSALRTVSSLPSVIYRRDGSASSDLELYVTMRVGVANEYRAILVAPATGRVDMFRYTGTAWVRATP